MNLVLLSLCIIGILGNFAHSITIEESKKLNYRLNADIEPLDYIIDVTPYFNGSVSGKEPFTFDGICTITFKTKKPNIDTITLHKFNLNIIEESLVKKSKLFAQFAQKVEKINIQSHEYDNRTEKYTLKLASTLVKDELYILKFKYTGSLTNGKGFYRTAYKEGNVTKWLASTHMEPANARKMFPGFDEPRLKATFSVIINRPPHFKPSISNMPLISSHHTSSNLVREYFQKSPKMSTYLLAVIVSEFECRENALKNYSVCFQPSARDQSEYSFNFGQKMLKKFDELFDYPFSAHMPKMSMAAVPFFGGGMENWGLIIYGDKSLLVDPKSSTPKKHQSTAGLIAHEIAHMWFGDLVTCDWWSNTWLNEGFATYFQTFALALVEPSWNVDQQFIVDKIQSVFSDDSIESSLPLNYDANTSNELHGRFGSISYSKGASVIRMFSHILGDDKFISGLRNYLKKNALKTAVPENLYTAFQMEVKNELNVTEVFDSWVSQPGFPVLNVYLASDQKHILIRQKRYLDSNPNHEDKTQYNVPLTWASNNENSDFSKTKPMAMLLNSSLQISLNKPIDWIVFNVQQTGYYRVNYDKYIWSAIVNILHKSYSTVHVLNRAQIIDDVLKLARFSYSNYKTAIYVVDYLQNEIDYVPWKAAFNNFDFILARFKPDEELLFKKFEAKLLNKVYKYLGFHSKVTDKHLDIYNRNNVVKNACQAGLKECLADARTEFDNLVKGNYTIPDDLLPVVYHTIVEQGGATEWNYFLKKLKSTTLDDERKILLNTLGYTKRDNLLKKYLELILTNEIRLEDKRSALLSTLAQKQNLRLVLDFVISKHKAIDDVFGSREMVPELLSKLASLSMNNEEINRIQKFVQQNDIDSKEKVKTALENAKLNLKWASKNVPIILSTIKKILQSSK